MTLPQPDQWALVEDLDPDISHFEFFLSKGPSHHQDWGDDQLLLAAGGQRNRCVWGWPSTSFLGQDLTPLTISPDALELLKALENAGPETPLAEVCLHWAPERKAELARELIDQNVMLPVAVGAA